MTGPLSEPHDEADEESLDEAVQHLESLLIPNERLEAYAVQRRLFALTHRRSLVGATTGRFIGMSRGLFGGFSPDDVRWQDLKTTSIRVGVFGAELTIVAFTSPDLAIAGETRTLVFTGLRKADAQKVYRICQAHEQAWREKRRVRELEELRAKSGGIHLPPAYGQGSGERGGAVERESPTARLEQARGMLEKGLITDSEYESLKARIVGSL